MNIVVCISHPSHVHLFKHYISELTDRGNDVLIAAIDKDNTFGLLEKCGLDYLNLGSYGESLFSKAVHLPLIDLRLLKGVNAYKPDLFIGESAIAASHISYLMRKNCITFEDTEHATEQIMLYHPFVSTILTPSCFRRHLGEKQVNYEGYKELAYLHPNRFRPDPSVLDEIGISRGERYIVLRFVSWRATHDVGHHGIRNKKNLIKTLEEYGHVMITSEGPLERELQKYRIVSSPEKIHTILYYAHLYLGEGATMATESALLGTPSIYISSLAGSMGNFAELENRYDLLYEFISEDLALDKAISLLNRSNPKHIWRQKVDRLLKEKIDLTAFMVWFTENYPNSLHDLKEEAHLQDKFKYYL